MIGLVAAVLVLLERLPVSRFRPARLLRPYLASDVVYLLTGYVALGWLSEPGLRAATGAGAAPWPALPWGVQLLVAVLAIDLGNYVAHWLMHRFDLLWEFHKVHHSSLHLDWMATFRSHIVEQLLRRGVALVLLVVCGCPVMVVLPAAAVFLAWGMLNHANVRVPLGLLETVFITPRLHRLHHVPATTERNLGTVFTFWDRLRGTLVIADPSPATPLGLPRERARYPQDWPRQFVAPWRALAARVGWSPAAGGYTASNSGR